MDLFNQNINPHAFFNMYAEYLIENPFKLLNMDVFSSPLDVYNYLIRNQGHNYSKEVFDQISTKINDFFNSSYQLSFEHKKTYIDSEEQIPSYYIDEENIKDFVKNIFFPYYKDSLNDFLAKKSNFSEDKIHEFEEALKIINKHCPELIAPDLKKNNTPDAKNTTDIIKYLNKQIDILGETYQAYKDHNTTDTSDFPHDIYSACSSLFPGIEIELPSREKSNGSIIKNLIKEFHKSINSIIATNPEHEIKLDDVKKQFDLSGVIKDFSAMTIILKNIPQTTFIDPSFKNFNEIIKYKAQADENIAFLIDLQYYMLDFDENKKIDMNKMRQIEIELLKRLRDSSFDECTNEFNGTSFADLLKKRLLYYCKLYCNDKDSWIDKDSMVQKECLNFINTLINELNERIYDRFYFEYLKSLAPVLLSKEYPFGKMSNKFKPKTVIKPNGYVSIYYYFETNNNLTIEMQFMTHFRYQESKRGPSDHNKMASKKIDLSIFFEKNNNTLEPTVNDEEYYSYLKLLDSYAYEDYQSLQKLPTMSTKQRSLFNQLSRAYHGVKIKKSMSVTYESPQLSDNVTKTQDNQFKKALKVPECPYRSTFQDNEEKHIETMYIPMEDYIKKFYMPYYVPDMQRISQPLTYYYKGASLVIPKSTFDTFRELLLQSGRVSCLTHLFLEYLKILYPETYIRTYDELSH